MGWAGWRESGSLVRTRPRFAEAVAGYCREPMAGDTVCELYEAESDHLRYGLSA